MKIISPLALLLKYEGYPTAVAMALLMHGVLLYFLIGSGVLNADFVDLDQPVYINATTIDVNPQRLRRLEQVQQQRQSEQRAEQQRQAAAATQAREAQQAQEAQEREAAERVEAQRQERELTERRNREEAEIEAARTREAEQVRAQEEERVAQLAREQAAREQAAREAELNRQAEAQRQSEQASTDNQNVQAYTAFIHDTVSRNWSVPPSARNGMLVVLELKLVPTGEVVSSRILQASGDAAFDRSALQAIDRVGRFPELQQMPIRLFEQIRTIRLEFYPEDLLR